MQTLKNRLEIYKLNRQIRSLNNELSGSVALPDYNPYVIVAGGVPKRVRESEKTHVLRDNLNNLVSKRDSLISR